MAKDTLLEMVQDILSDSDGDDVNSIGDTVESEQCASVIKQEFLMIADQMDLEHHKGVTQLTATGASTPSIMTRPEGFYDIAWVQYDKRVAAGGDPDFQEVLYMPNDMFVRMVMALNASDTTVDQYTVNSISFNCYNDRAPRYYTFLDGYDSIVFDAYDSNLETNLQASKSLAYGVQRPTLTIADATVPDLPQNLMSLLRNRSRAMWFDLYKDGTTKEIDKRQRNSEVRAQRQRHIAARNRRKDQRRTPDYGRK
jgi:hypothetical protein